MLRTFSLLLFCTLVRAGDYTDTVTSFLANLPGGGMTVKNFVVAGASKRGWTTWSTAAVDPRVAAIAPIVIDTLNVPPVFQHTYQAYGFWPPATTPSSSS